MSEDIFAQIFHTVTMPLRKVLHPDKTVAKASGVFCTVCLEKPPYHTAQELWGGLKQADEGARLLLILFLCLRKNERMRYSVQKAIASEGKRWVDVLIEEACRLYMLMPHSAVPYQERPKSVIAIKRSSATQRAVSEGEGCSQVASNTEGNMPAVGCVVDGQLVQQAIYQKP